MLFNTCPIKKPHNAYGALGRLRDRYKIEKANLTSEQQFALQKVFMRNTFIGGMMQVRL